MPASEEADETKAVENLLKQSTESQENSQAVKETLVDDLNAEIGEGEEEDEEANRFDSLMKESEAGETKRKSRNPQGEPNKLSLEKDNSDEEVKTIEIEEKDTSKAEVTYDYSVMEEFLEFFDEDELQPILCGYFNKVMQALLTKSKSKVLNFLLIHKRGDLFNKLLKNLEHHSLAQLLIELMQIKITGQASGERGRVSSDYDNKTDDEEEKSKDNQEKEVFSPQEQIMNEVLNTKRQEVIVSLIDCLSAKNKEDFEACLNAHQVLTELTENEITFGKLIQRDNVVRLIEAACDLQNKQNQGYALSVLANIIKEYPDYERSLGQA